MGAFLTTTISAVKYYEGAENTTRFNYKLSGTNERDQTYKRWWKEQIRLYGTEIDYYVRNFTLSATDKVYGENTHQGYHPIHICNVDEFNRWFSYVFSIWFGFR